MLTIVFLVLSSVIVGSYLSRQNWTTFDYVVLGLNLAAVGINAGILLEKISA